MPIDKNLAHHVTGPVLQLAAQVKELLETDTGKTVVDTDYGTFYVSRVELVFYEGGESEVVGYLTPDEADGSTFDFWLPKER